MRIFGKTPVYFTGFMATGKSRLGELMAAALGWKHVDSDVVIEKKAGKSISAIFADEGESAFRRMEVETIRELSTREGLVISLGGGALKSPEVVDVIKASGVLVGLWAEPETILKRVNRKDTRPLLSGLSDEDKLAKIKTMLVERAPLYALADFQMESREDIPHHVLIKKLISRLQLEYIDPVRVELGERSYPIYFREDASGFAGAVADKTGCPRQYVIVTDTTLRQCQKDFLARLGASLERSRVFYFRPGEKEKNLASVNRLISYMLRHQYTRKTTLVAFGGGVLGDMTGFTASIYLRGVSFLQVPSTLLAMVDSSVGGKTGVNHKLGKNLIGAFYQPRAVLIDPLLLSTLPFTELQAGLAEVIKYAIIWDEKFFNFLETNAEMALERDPAVLTAIIRRCCEIKAEVVGKDECEHGLRAILNYGHTFAHALEAEGEYGGITHGLAVALGMRVAMRLAVLLGLASAETENLQQRILSRYRMPSVYAIDPARAWELMASDKKNEARDRVYILPRAIGRVEKVKNVDKALVFEAWKAILPAAQAKVVS